MQGLLIDLQMYCHKCMIATKTYSSEFKNKDLLILYYISIMYR
jgi:hypothetical protein